MGYEDSSTDRRFIVLALVMAALVALVLATFVLIPSEPDEPPLPVGDPNGENTFNYEGDDKFKVECSDGKTYIVEGTGTLNCNTGRITSGNDQE